MLLIVVQVHSKAIAANKDSAVLLREKRYGWLDILDALRHSGHPGDSSENVDVKPSVQINTLLKPGLM